MRIRRALACGVGAATLLGGLLAPGGVSSYAAAAADSSALAPGAAIAGRVARAPRFEQRVSNGLIAFQKDDENAGTGTTWLVNPSGHGQPWQLSSNDYGCPDWSPDGQVLVVCDGVPETSAVLLDPHTGAAFRSFLQPDPTLDVECYKWSPDGSRIGCDGSSLVDPGQGGAYSIRASDGGDLRLMAANSGVDGGLGGFSPDGRRIVYYLVTADGDSGLYTAAVDGTDIRRLSPPNLIVLSGGDWSLDGKRIIFGARTDSDHRSSVWTIRPDGTDLRQVPIKPPGSACGGAFEDPTSVGCASPEWSPDGRYIVYQHVTPARVDLQIAQANGTYVRSLTDRMDDGGQRLEVEFPDWQPLLHED